MEPFGGSRIRDPLFFRGKLRERRRAPFCMAVYLDETCTRKAAEVPFPASTDWQEVQGSFSAPAGTFPLFFRLNCTGRVDWESFTLT